MIFYSLELRSYSETQLFQWNEETYKMDFVKFSMKTAKFDSFGANVTIKAKIV